METILKGYIEEELRALGEDVELDVDDDLALIGFDSIAYVRLIAFIKERFEIRVRHAEVTVEQFGTVSAIASYLGAQGATPEPTRGDGQ